LGKAKENRAPSELYQPAQQTLAADGAIACFSSSFFPLNLSSDCAPQLWGVFHDLKDYIKARGVYMAASTDNQSESSETLASRNPFCKFVASFRKPSQIVFSDGELRTELKWELEKHLSLYQFYFELSVKAIALFYAIVGAILSIYFAKEGSADSEVKSFLLWAPLIMSLVLGTAFFTGGIWWWRVKRKIDWIAEQIKMKQAPDIAFLSYVLWIFGVLFFFAAWGLYRIGK
jgi:hypothetical protein